MPERWLPPRPPGGPERPLWPAPPGAHRSVPAPQAPRSNEPAGTAALILGIAGVVIVLLSVGLLFVVSLPCSVAAWIVGARARGRADRSEPPGQRDHAHAGMVLGMVGTALGVLALVGWVLAFVLIDDLADDLDDDPVNDRDPDSGDGDRARPIRLGVRIVLAAIRACTAG